MPAKLLAGSPYVVALHLSNEDNRIRRDNMLGRPPAYSPQMHGYARFFAASTFSFHRLDDPKFGLSLWKLLTMLPTLSTLSMTRPNKI